LADDSDRHWIFSASQCAELELTAGTKGLGYNAIVYMSLDTDLS